MLKGFVAAGLGVMLSLLCSYVPQDALFQAIIGWSQRFGRDVFSANSRAAAAGRRLFGREKGRAVRFAGKGASWKRGLEQTICFQLIVSQPETYNPPKRDQSGKTKTIVSDEWQDCGFPSQ